MEIPSEPMCGKLVEWVGKIVYSHLLMRMDLLCMKQATQKRTGETFVGRRSLRGSGHVMIGRYHQTMRMTVTAAVASASVV